MFSKLGQIKFKAVGLRTMVALISAATLANLSPATALFGGTNTAQAVTAHYFTRHGVCSGSGSFTGNADVDVQFFQDTNGLIRMVYVLITQYKQPSGANYDWATSATIYDKSGSVTNSSWAGNPAQSQRWLATTVWSSYTSNRYAYVHLSGGISSNECIVKVPAL